MVIDPLKMVDLSFHIAMCEKSRVDGHGILRSSKGDIFPGFPASIPIRNIYHISHLRTQDDKQKKKLTSSRLQ